MNENIFKNRKHYKYVLFLIMVASIIIAKNVRLMAETTPDPISSAESTVEVEFTEGDADVDPLDPDDPEIPGNGGTDEGGSLALNYVSYFDFGKHAISTVEKDYPTTNRRPYIQVTDVRGTGSGWAVNARMSKFENKGVESLKGSTINFKDASLATPTVDIDEPTPTPSFTLKADGETTVNVVTADPGTGMGTWLVKWYKYPSSTPNHSVMLTVPGGSGMLEENTAKIKWLLTDGPTD